MDGSKCIMSQYCVGPSRAALKFLKVLYCYFRFTKAVLDDLSVENFIKGFRFSREVENPDKGRDGLTSAPGTRAYL